jgi:hypothetical protein
MDISENTQDSPTSLDLDEVRPIFAGNTASSSSTTLSANQIVHEDNSLQCSDVEVEKIVSTITQNLSSLKTTNNETLDNRSNRLMPVTTNSHPLMLNDSDSEDSYNNSNSNRKVNYPDVVPQIEQKHQPLRLANPILQKPHSSKRTTTTKTSTTSSKTVDVVNRVNNNNNGSGRRSTFKKPMYREPSPVSLHSSFRKFPE